MDGFYVTVIKGQPKPQNIAWAAGPFATYEEAHDKEGAVREYVLLTYPDTHWCSFGVTRLRRKRGRALPLGKLNAKFGFTPTAG